MASRVLISMLCLAIAGCGGDAPPAESAAKPATVTAPVKEAQLTTVTLSEDAERRLAIKMETVAQRAVPRTRTIGGEIMAPSGTALAITAPVAGTLQATAAVPTAGLSVLRGQTLFRLVPIQPSERDAAVDAQQAVDTTTARRDAAVLKVQRAERLVKDGSVSRRALEEAQAELAVAEADLKAARERVALATRSGTSSGGVLIEAPEAATVQNVHVRAGQTVAAGTPLIDLVRLATVWVRVPVYAGEARAIDTNAPADVQPLGESTDAARRDRAANRGTAVSQRLDGRRRSVLLARESEQSLQARRARGGSPATPRIRNGPRRPQGRVAARCVRRHVGVRRQGTARLCASARGGRRHHREPRGAVARTCRRCARRDRRRGRAVRR